MKQTEKLFYLGTEIEIISTYKYLRLYFTPKLTLTKTKEVLATQTHKAASSIFRPASVAQLDAPSHWRPGGCGFNPRRGRQNSFVEIDHEIFSTVTLSLPLIQEGQLSVSGKRMYTAG